MHACMYILDALTHTLNKHRSAQLRFYSVCVSVPWAPTVHATLTHRDKDSTLPIITKSGHAPFRLASPLRWAWIINRFILIDLSILRINAYYAFDTCVKRKPGTTFSIRRLLAFGDHRRSTDPTIVKGLFHQSTRLAVPAP